MSEKLLESALKDIPAEVLTEEVKQSLLQVLHETVETRISAKVQLLEEELKNKEVQLTESFAQKEALLKEELAQNEKVLVEEAEKFKNELELSVITETKKFKDKVEKEALESAEKYRNDIEQMVLEESKALKERNDTALVEEVRKFRSEMIDRVSDYLDAQLNESIPSDMIEAAAKLEVYEPLVEAIKHSFASNYIKLDTTSYAVIKEAKDRIGDLETQLQEVSKKELSLKKEMKEVQKNMKIETLTEGLTAKQKGRAVKLLEGVALEDLDNKYNTIRDIIIQESIEVKKPEAKKPAPKTEKLVESQSADLVDDSASEIVKLQVKKVISKEIADRQVLTESKKQPTVQDLWKAKLDKQINRT